MDYDIEISFTLFSLVTLSPDEFEAVLGLKAGSKGRFGAKSPAHRKAPQKNWTRFRSLAGEEDAPFKVISVLCRGYPHAVVGRCEHASSVFGRPKFTSCLSFCIGK